MTDSELHHRADELFDRALDLDGPERVDFLDRECGDDPALRSLVERLVAGAEAETTTGAGLVTGGALLGDPLDGSLLAKTREEPEGLEVDETGLTGRTIGRYEVGEELGRGGMAVVYRGRRVDDFDQQVAVKVMRRELDSAEALRRFHRERQILASATHPNIARLLDGGVTAGHRPYLVMEHVRGEPIDRWCDARRLGLRGRIELFLEVARAVEHAHRNLVVHRDIKPSNILVTDDGHVKLLDFGIAKLLDPETAETTRTELRPMTPAFAGPEQIDGGPVTTATDVYQLGMLLYVLLTGCWPYKGDARSDAALLMAIVRDPPTRPSTAVVTGAQPREVSGAGPATTAAQLAAARDSTPERLRRLLRGDLDTILLKALRKEPEARYGTVARLIDDLERYLAGRVISARPETLAYRARKLVGRHRLATAVLAAAIAVVVTLVLWNGHRLERERDRARGEAAKATEVADFLTSLFAGAAPSQARGETVTVRELLDRGVGRVREELVEQPAVRAEMMEVMGRAYGELALYDEGRELLADALTLRRELGDPTAVADTLDARARLHADRKDHAAARRDLEEALEIRRKILGDESAEVARTEIRLARVLTDDGYAEEGLTLLQDAVDRLERTGTDRDDLARGLISLAVALQNQRDYEESIPVFRRGIEILEADLGADHPDAMSARFNLAYSLRWAGEPEKAGALYRRTIDEAVHLYGPRHPRVANVYNTYGLLLRGEEKYDEALASHHKAVEIWSEALGPDHIQVAWAYNNIGLVEKQRQRPEAAREPLRRSLEITEAALGPDHPEMAVALFNYGDVLLASGEPEPAVAVLERSLALREAVHGVGHGYTTNTLYSLGRAHLEVGNLEAAEDAFRRSVASGRTDPEHRDDDVTRPTLWLARTLARQGRSEVARELLAAERDRATEEGREAVDAVLEELI